MNDQYIITLSLLPLWQMLLIAAVSGVAGLVNAVAGGGTLLTFPVLLLVGIPPIMANITNTVALCPGFLGGTLAQIQDLRGQRQRLLRLLPISSLGGIVGGFLLLRSSEATFTPLIPWLILLATGLLASQNYLKQWQQQRLTHASSSVPPRANLAWSLLPVGIAAIYGGYFGPGLGVILLAILGTFFDDSLTHLNALKQLLSLGINATVALLFVFSGQIIWPIALVMATGALLGGMLGGQLAQRLSADLLRQLVIGVGVLMTIIYLVRR
jgi:uncharacterized protein